MFMNKTLRIIVFFVLENLDTNIYQSLLNHLKILNNQFCFVYSIHILNQYQTIGVLYNRPNSY